MFGQYPVWLVSLGVGGCGGATTVGAGVDGGVTGRDVVAVAGRVGPGFVGFVSAFGRAEAAVSADGAGGAVADAGGSATVAEGSGSAGGGGDVAAVVSSGGASFRRTRVRITAPPAKPTPPKSSTRPRSRPRDDFAARGAVVKGADVAAGIGCSASVGAYIAGVTGALSGRELGT